VQHFVAYHSAETMGYEYKPVDSYVFHSSKPLSLLQRAVGSAMWAINGTRRKRDGSLYTLRAVFIPEDIVDGEGSDFKYAVVGNLGINFDTPIPLNDLPWFAELLRTQNNFSFGINEIKEPVCVAGLLRLANGMNLQSFMTEHELDLPVDVDELDNMEVPEGMATFVTHLRRERNQSLVEAKKAGTLARTGCLACEICGFDFAEKYGEHGEGFCEVHHTTPLASLREARVTKLSDLAIVCSNCHRVLHRTRPALSVGELRSHVAAESKESNSAAPVRRTVGKVRPIASRTRP
jgi:5-methylcytosine-specific restriction endonuclease McrA